MFLELGSNIIIKVVCPLFLWKQFLKDMKGKEIINICFIFIIISSNSLSKKICLWVNKIIKNNLIY